MTYQLQTDLLTCKKFLVFLLIKNVFPNFLFATPECYLSKFSIVNWLMKPEVYMIFESILSNKIMRIYRSFEMSASDRAH